MSLSAIGLRNFSLSHALRFRSNSLWNTCSPENNYKNVHASVSLNNGSHKHNCFKVRWSWRLDKELHNCANSIVMASSLHRTEPKKRIVGWITFVKYIHAINQEAFFNIKETVSPQCRQLQNSGKVFLHCIDIVEECIARLNVNQMSKTVAFRFR